jgi:membrane protein DedA with SNARE-associated domain
MLKKWAMLILFVVAATPLPDEPVVIPLGLIRYNPAKLFLAYFAGKLVIGVAGAYLGAAAGASPINDQLLMIISIAVTIVITIVLLRIDFEKLAEKILKRKIPLIPR